MKSFELSEPQSDKALESIASLKAREQAEYAGLLADLHAKETSLNQSNPSQVANHKLEVARALVGLERGAEAWPIGLTAVGIFTGLEDWSSVADACEVLYRADQPGSLMALGQGIWLVVTFPLDPELTVQLLTHLVDETPDHSDGAAVAAVTALFLVEHRVEDERLQERLYFFSSQILGQVARRHSQVETQEQFDAWLERLELKDPGKFLVRLRNVIDVLVQDDWWFDRDLIQSKLP
jgi:hypothetical protein